MSIHNFLYTTKIKTIMTVFIKAVNIWTLHEKESMVSNKFNSIMRATLPSKLHAYNYALNTTGE